MTNDEIAIIPAGSVLYITNSEYDSSHSVDGIFYAVKDVDTEALRDKWVSIHPNQDKMLSFERDNFVDWIVSQGLLEPKPSFTWFIGNSGDDALQEGIE